jgi:hypothetical protein
MGMLSRWFLASMALFYLAFVGMLLVGWPV